MDKIRIISFNVLASNYIDMIDYPNIDIKELSSEERRYRITKFLNFAKLNADIIALQEVTYDTYNTCTNKLTVGEFTHYSKVLNPEFQGLFEPHEIYYWNENKYKNCRFMFNGNALFFRKSIFQLLNYEKISLQTGNNTLLTNLLFVPGNIYLQVLNVHLDSEYLDRREKELYNLLVAAENERNKDYDKLSDKWAEIIVGDFNSQPNITTFSNLLYRTQLLTKVNIYRSTFPNSGAIDHIYYRSNILQPYTGSLLCFDTDTSADCEKFNDLEYYTKVFDFNLSLSLKDVIRMYGSDHIPIIGTLVIK